MKINKSEIKIFLWPGVILALCVSLAFAAIYFTGQLRSMRHQDLVQKEKALNNAKLRLQRADEEIRLIVKYSDDYKRLKQKGFIGSEQRINWLDTLRQTNQRLGLFGIQYQIEPQQPYAAPPGVTLSGYQLQQSVMKLEFGVLHEEDLMRFINAVAAEEAGIFVLKECALTRNNVTESVVVQPNLKAQCELLWLSLKTS